MPIGAATGTIAFSFKLLGHDEPAMGSAMKSKASIIALASALFVSQASWAFAQSAPGGPGTTGGGTPPAAKSNQMPSVGSNQATTPPGTQGPAAASSSGTVGRSTQASKVEQKPDPIVEESEREVSRRIKSICKGC